MEKYYYLENLTTLKGEILAKVIEKWQNENGIDSDVFDEFLEMMKLVDSNLNKEMVKVLLKLDEVQFDVLHNAYDAIVADNIDLVAMDTMDDFKDWLYGNDFKTPDDWYELADTELKNWGVEAECISWVNEIDFDCELLQIDDYHNYFNGYAYIEAFVEYLISNLQYIF